MTISDDELHDMSDEELEAAFKEARSATPEVDEDESLDDNTTRDDDPADDLADDDTGGEAEAEEEDNEDAEAETDGEVAPDEGEDLGNAAEELPDEEDSPTGKAPAPAAPVKTKYSANGKEYEFTEDEIKQMFPRVFGQAMDYTKKLQTIQPWRRTIDAIEQAKLNHQDVSLMIDVMKGDKNAIAEVLKRTGVDTLDIDTEESKYIARDYGRSSGELAIADVIESIKDDPEYVTTHRVITSEWDEPSWAVLSKDPNKIRQLHIDVKTGVYARLQPEAEKLKLYDGGRGTDLDYYMAAAKEFYTREEQQRTAAREHDLQERERQLAAQTRVSNVQQQQVKRDVAKDNANRRRAAAPTGRATARATVTDYLSASDEQFDEWYKRITDNG